jgi:hypothetical protein
LVRAFHTYPDDDVNDDEGLRPLKPRGIAFPAILFARAPLKTDDDAFGVFVEVKIVLLLKVVVGDDVFCDVFRIVIIASAAWVRAALFVANNTPRRRIPKEDILFFFLCVKKRSLSKVSRLTTTTTTTKQKSFVQSAVFLSAFTLKFYEKRDEIFEFSHFLIALKIRELYRHNHQIIIMEATTRRRTHSA